MQAEPNPRKFTEQDVAISFNMGFKIAVSVLEMAEELSPEGRRFLLEKLKKQIAKSE